MSVIYRVVTTSLIVLFCRLAVTTAIASGCDREAAGCSQLCVSSSTGQSPRCTCVPGYTLESDGTGCVADTWAIPGVILVYNEAGKLQAANLSALTSDDDTERRRRSRSSVQLHRSNSRIDAIDVDVSRQKIYFALKLETSELRSVSLGGDGDLFDKTIERRVDDEFMNGLGEVHSVAVDWVGDNVYVADVPLRCILACSLRSRRCVAVHDNIVHAGSLAVDSNNGRLYWNDCSESGTLETSALDGQGRRTLLRGIGCVLSLTIDLPLQTIYWVNMFGPGIGYCPLSNCTRVSSIEFEHELHYHAVTVFEDDLICAADSSNSDYGSTVMLGKFNKFSPTADSAMEIKDHLTAQPTILRVMHGGLQVSGGQACSSLDCSHICLLTSAVVARCVCPAGLKLDLDGRQCSADWQQESLLIASGSDVLRMSVDHVGGLIDDVIFSAAAASRDVVAMSYDSVTGALYTAVSSDEPDGDYIARVSLQQQPLSREEVLFGDLTNVTDMDIDDVNVYWIAGRKLMVGRKDGAGSRTLVEVGDDTTRLSSVSVDGRNQRLLYADCGVTVSTVRACNLSAGDCVVLFNRTRCVRDLRLDDDVNKLFWIEASIVMSRNVAETRVEYVKTSPAPRAVSTTSELTVWTDEHEAAVYLTSKSTSSHVRVMRTGRPSLSALTVAAPADSAQRRVSGCGEKNGGCSELCVSGKTGESTSHRCLCADRHNVQYNDDVCSRPQQISVTEAGEGGVTSHGVGEGTCRQLQCLNGGVCVTNDQQLETCRCPAEFVGRRCERVLASERPSAGSDAGKDQSSSTSVGVHVYVAVVIVALLVTCAVVVAVCCVLKRRQRGSSVAGGDELIVKTEPSYEKCGSKPGERSESSFSTKPFALPRPSLVDSGNTMPRDNAYVQ